MSRQGKIEAFLLCQCPCYMLLESTYVHQIDKKMVILVFKKNNDLHGLENKFTLSIADNPNIRLFIT